MALLRKSVSLVSKCSAQLQVAWSTQNVSRLLSFLVTLKRRDLCSKDVVTNHSAHAHRTSSSNLPRYLCQTLSVEVTTWSTQQLSHSLNPLKCSLLLLIHLIIGKSFALLIKLSVPQQNSACLAKACLVLSQVTLLLTLPHNFRWQQIAPVVTLSSNLTLSFPRGLITSTDKRSLKL